MDVDHTQCTFGAIGFQLKIFDRDGLKIYELSEQPGYCCPFQAPDSQAQPGEYSSIYWPGTVNRQGMPGYGCYVNDGTYFYTLELQDPCDNEYTDEASGWIQVIASPGPGNCNPSYRIANPDSTEDVVTIDMGKLNVPVDDVPTDIIFSYDLTLDRAMVRLTGGEGRRLESVQLFGMDGRLIYSNGNCTDVCTLSMNGVSSGIYLLRAISSEGMLRTYKFLKQ